MEFSQEQKSYAEIVPSVDVELNEEQLDIVSGGVMDDGSGNGCTGLFIKFKTLPDVISLPGTACL